MLALDPPGRPAGPRGAAPGPDAASKASAVAPFVGDEVAVVVHVRPRRSWTPRRSPAGSSASWPTTTDVARRHDGRRRLGRRPEEGRREGPVPAGRPGRHARLPGRRGAAGRRGRRPGDRPGAHSGRAGVPGPLAGRRDDPGRRGRRHARPPWPGSATPGPRPGPSWPRPWPPGATPRSGSRSSPAPPSGGRSRRRCPTLPPQVGGGPITTVTRGMTWASLAVAFEPEPAVRAVVQAKDADAAGALRKIAQDALEPARPGDAGSTRRSAELAKAIGRIKPEATRATAITLEADLEKAAALVGRAGPPGPRGGPPLAVRRTTSSRSAWRCTITTPPTTPSRAAFSAAQGRQAAPELAGPHPAVPRARRRSTTSSTSTSPGTARTTRP